MRQGLLRWSADMPHVNITFVCLLFYFEHQSDTKLYYKLYCKSATIVLGTICDSRVTGTIVPGTPGTIVPGTRYPGYNCTPGTIVPRVQLYPDTSYKYKSSFTSSTLLLHNTNLKLSWRTGSDHSTIVQGTWVPVVQFCTRVQVPVRGYTSIVWIPVLVLHLWLPVHPLGITRVQVGTYYNCTNLWNINTLWYYYRVV